MEINVTLFNKFCFSYIYQTMSSRYHKRKRLLENQASDENVALSPKEVSETVEQEVPQSDAEFIEKTLSLEREPCPSVPIEVECASNVPGPVEEKKEVVEEKVKRKRKAKTEAAPSSSDGTQPPAPPTKKSRKDKLLDDFLMTQLPALQKDVKLKKKDQVAFHIRDYADYFKAGSEWTPTYCLALFNFLGKNEILCDRYGVFEGGRHSIHTVDGFTHANIIQSSVGDMLSPEETTFMMNRYGKEWFKIPAKDAPHVSTAYRFGDGHQFKVIIFGIEEGSFFGKDGKEILSLTPKLRYEAYKAPPEKVKKPKKAPEPVSEPPVDQSLSEIL
jgi:hypothetical protein